MFSRTQELWEAGKAAAYLPLAGWRLLDLEASLLRAQHRFPEALERLGQALALCGGEPLATGRILLKKERVSYQLGDFEAALATLADAAPFVQASRDPHLLFALLFNTASDLCSLERFTEAASGLPGVREMAIEQGRELDLIRVAWLAAKVDAGQGRKEQAVARLEQVSRDFEVHNLPYEAALSSLELAVLLLEAGRTAEVRHLAFSMQRIFGAKKIDREALAALRLFCEAAIQEGATVELAKQAIAEIERAARRLAPPS
jgi:tetratricopeptide (TPR) repeat protein